MGGAGQRAGRHGTLRDRPGSFPGLGHGLPLGHHPHQRRWQLHHLVLRHAHLPAGPLPASKSLRIFVMVGICGGFTTSPRSACRRWSWRARTIGGSLCQYRPVAHPVPGSGRFRVLAARRIGLPSEKTHESAYRRRRCPGILDSRGNPTIRVMTEPGRRHRRPGLRAVRRLHRRERSARTARRRQGALRRQRRAARRSPMSSTRSRRAASGSTRPRQAEIDRIHDRPRRHAGQVEARRQRHPRRVHGGGACGGRGSRTAAVCLSGRPWRHAGCRCR